MAKIIGLPKLSPTMEEGVLVRWAKNEGDLISVDDLIAEIETDKATMEFRSFDPGVLLKRLVSEGTTLLPDQPVAIMGKAGEDFAQLWNEHGLVTTLQAPAPIAQGSPVAPEDAVIPLENDAPALPVLAARMITSPLVRKLARERELDLRQITGTGPRGRIIKRDLDALQTQAPAASAKHPPDSAKRQVEPTVATPNAGQRVPLTSMRKTIARRLSESKREVPHFYLFADAEVSDLVAARTLLNAQLAGDGLKLSVNDFVLFAVARALHEVPACNVTFHDDGIQHYEHVSLSIAVAIEGGLVTPVIRNAEQLNLSELACEMQRLGQRARARQLKSEELEGGTFSVSNLGMFGVDSFSAILNPPQAGILAVGALRDEPVVKAGQVVVGKRLTLGLSADHRAVDGADAAKLLAAIKKRLESPLRLLL